MESKIAQENEDKFVRVMQAFAMVREAKMLQHLQPWQLIKVLLFCDIKGFLHYKYDGKKMIFVACGYMLPKFDEATAHIIPMKSEGDVLYIPWVISRAEDKTVPKQVISEYIKEHPNTKQIVFYKGDSKMPTKFNRKVENANPVNSVEQCNTAVK